MRNTLPSYEKEGGVNVATIRSLTRADLPVVVPLADEAARRALIGRPMWETEADAAAELDTPKRTFVVAVDETGTVTGMAGYRLRSTGEAELYGPLVAVEGLGTGAWIESRVTSMAAQEGATSFSMLIGISNKEGQAWAEWRGYLRDSEAPELLHTWLYPGELRDVTAGEGLVRRAVAADLERVDCLVQENFAHRRTQPATWLENAWVVEKDGQVAGCLRLDPAAAWVDYLCVDPVWRRRGLSTLLLTEVIRRFWDGAPRKVGLAVPLDDTAPVSLFRRLGFRREVPVARWVKR
jgi:ribosomal protein S18 acetylase RimI-like enzyme